MVQKEVKKKTSVYSTAAVLMAIVLVSTVYILGSAPIIFPSGSPDVAGMRTFSSNDEIKEYLSTDSSAYSSRYYGGPLDSNFFGSEIIPSQTSTGKVGYKPPAEYWSRPNTEYPLSSSDGYSTTNIQVAGVDEADSVKTDGNFIYTISNSQSNGYHNIRYYMGNTNIVNIIDANPQHAQIVSKIILDNNTQPAGLFLSSDASKLVIIASEYQTYYNSPSWETDSLAPMIMPSRQSDVYTFINVYDVSDKTNPMLERNFTASGSYFNSRLIEDNLYIVVSQTAWIYNNKVSYPVTYEGNHESQISPTSIYYADINDSSFTFTSFYGLNILDTSEAPTNMTVLMGSASSMYVSNGNMYITYSGWDQSTGPYTAIYRVAINGLQLNLEAQGSVPGVVLNQYAMDEFNGYFRIATNYYATESQISNIYVLNLDLKITGKLEGLAPNENLHSVRFMGNKCYLVTFRVTDPLFVIDLSDQANPIVLGELKISGYSDYLHPYSDTHLIGIGKEAVEADGGSMSYYQGVKLALFDVSNVKNPIQISNVIIGDRGSDSPVLSNPKAFLFDKSKSLLVIPISVAIVSDQLREQMEVSAYGTTVWQGAYIYSLNADDGFTLKGTVTHLNPILLDNNGYLKNSNDYYTTQNQWITRSLYIDNVLYTISDSQVKLNSLSDLSMIKTVNLT